MAAATDLLDAIAAHTPSSFGSEYRDRQFQQADQRRRG